MSKNILSLIFIHNHPDNSFLSIQDIITLMSEDTMRATIAVSNNGTIHYAVKKLKVCK